MAYVQDICRVRICWLEPGDICLESKLRCTEFAECNVIARFEGSREPAYKRLGKEGMLRAILSPNSRFPFDGICSTVNPLVKVLVPVTLFEFDVADSREGWLASELMEGKAEVLFREFLQELENVGFYLWNKGHSLRHGPWGISVCFYTLWLCKLDLEDRPDLSTREFAGYVNLSRMPLSLFVEHPVKQKRPPRQTTLRVSSGTSLPPGD